MVGKMAVVEVEAVVEETATGKTAPVLVQMDNADA